MRRDENHEKPVLIKEDMDVDQSREFGYAARFSDFAARPSQAIGFPTEPSNRPSVKPNSMGSLSLSCARCMHLGFIEATGN